MDQELTQQQARKLGLPDRDPYSGDWLVWAAEPTPAQAPRVTKSDERQIICQSSPFETHAVNPKSILGEQRVAAPDSFDGRDCTLERTEAVA